VDIHGKSHDADDDSSDDVDIHGKSHDADDNSSDDVDIHGKSHDADDDSSDDVDVHSADDLTEPTTKIFTSSRKRNLFKRRKITKPEAPRFRLIPNVIYHAVSKLWGYINGVYGNWSLKELLNGYESFGVISLCIVKNGITEDLTTEDRRKIDALCSLVNSKRSALKDNSLVGTSSLINECEVTRLNEIDTKFDNGRRFQFHNYPVDGDEISEILMEWEDKFKQIGCIHPETNMINSQGMHGVDVISKANGVHAQGLHFDFGQYADDLKFKSWFSTKNNPSKILQYDPKRDGSASCFINPFLQCDHLGKPGGQYLILPSLTVSILRGDVAHNGTGNYNGGEMVCKIFAYFDPPKFKRIDSDAQFKVYKFNGDTMIVRKVAEPHDLVMTESIIPYNCISCGVKSLYSYPYCFDHLKTACGLKPFCTNKNIIGCKYFSRRPLQTGDILPGHFWPEVMEEECFLNRYRPLRGYGVVGAIPWISNSAHKKDLFFGCLSKLSFVSLLQTCTEIESSDLIFSQTAEGIRLVANKTITYGKEVTLYSPALPFCGLKIDVNEERVKSILRFR
jgi:hypothetical protein